MTLSISAATILTDADLDPNGAITAWSTPVDGSAVVALGITAIMTLHASATAGARVHVYSGPAFNLLGAFPTQTVDVPATHKSPAITGVSFSVLPGHKVYQVIVQNLDPVQHITGITVYAEPQVLS